MTTITVSDAFAPGLRSALLGEMGDAAGDIQDVAVLSDHQSYRERLEELLRRFDVYRDAFLALGWGDRPSELDRERHGWAVSTALRAWLTNATYFLDVDVELEGSAEQTRRAHSEIAEIRAFVADAGLELDR
jgi:hypothetical protein